MSDKDTGRRPGSGGPLPAGWRLQWLGKGERPDAAALSIDLATVADHGDAVSTAFWRHGLTPWGKSDFPLGEALLALGSFPALDEIWTLFLWSRREQGEDLPAAWEAICRYASDVRQGLWPDRVRPEHSPQAVYLALAQELLLGARPDRVRFLEEAFALCAHLGKRLSEGARLLDDDLLAGVAAFERYTSLLVKDRDLYQEDVGRSRRFWAEIPAVHSPTGTARRLPLLILEQPVARQFKLWARSDPNAPGGAGYPLLLTRLPNQAMVLSADPSQRVTVGWLAAGLSEREKAARGGEDGGWYDGKNHAGTLLAAPLDGTKLPLDDVLRHLKAELRLSPIASGKKVQAIRTAAIALTSMLAVAVAFFVLQKTKDDASSRAPPATPAGAAPAAIAEKPPSTPEQAPGGAKGEPLGKEEVVSLIQSDDGPRSMQHFALVAGVCSYDGEHKLHSPCRDARAMRDLLVTEYGYQKDHILFYVDKPEGGERVDGAPSAENMKSGVEKFRSRFGDNENSTFLFYYSGHGGYIKGAQSDFGVLQPTGFFSTLKDQPYQHRGWDMQRLIDDIKKGVPSRHIMLLLDACYSGWAGAKGDDELDTRVRSLWKEHAEVVLSAGSKGQRAWEDEVEPRAWVWGGHSVMTAFVLEGLGRGAEGIAHADTNKDGVVTDEELAGFVREKVPVSVERFKNKASQSPGFFRLDQGRVRSGQFLFVPAKRDGTQ